MENHNRRDRVIGAAAICLVIFVGGCSRGDMTNQAIEESSQHEPSNLMVQIQLLEDTEYRGALLDAAGITWIYPENMFYQAILKTDYLVNGVIYEGGSKINFSPSGNVLYGKVKTSASIQGQFVVAGTNVLFDNNGNLRRAFVRSSSSNKNYNLNIPMPSVIAWNEHGYVTSVTHNTGEPYRLLDWFCKLTSEVVYVPNESKYLISKCRVSRPFFMGVQSIGDERVPVVTSDNCIRHNFYKSNGHGSDFQYYDDQNFQFNGYDFKHSKVVMSDDYSISYFKIMQPLELDGVKYQYGTFLKLDLDGKVIRATNVNEGDIHL
ncbi:hypothetical protein A1QO_02815 [Vibrio genomosp. F10 str. ZF-129]|uniref:Uncharacterized protein n=1 Tax=Vibrio genomosp. F10 str. ZF-129 TaxID=1187848 RepID=A0A1E5BK89_9VIBR|nr:hypothetical protein [Vibrio genomosp. F10]OEE38328.1 hypothetical protein A1QO_02815 [Vibrio genomosp. F10 str. ZF-129]